MSAGLLAAQARNPTQAIPGGMRGWFDAASFASNVFEENPDLDTDHTHQLVDRTLDRLSLIPICLSHLDYGLSNIAAFKGGNKGYSFTPQQRKHYLAALRHQYARRGPCAQ